MKELEERILKDGKVINDDIIKVDSFINHQIDLKIVEDFAHDVVEHFKGEKIDKVLTIETSGIAIAYEIARQLGNKPLVFAKKSKSQIVDDNVYQTIVKSFTRQHDIKVTVSKLYLHEDERVLIVDDFLAEGNAALGLIDLCKQAKSVVVGVVPMVEKVFQGGHKKIEALGIKVYSGAAIKSFDHHKPVF